MDATAGSTIGLGSTGSSTKVKLTVAELALIEKENNEKNEKVKKVIAKMKTVIVSKRLFLEREFVKYDRRVLGFITVDEFKFVLNIFGLDNPEIVGSSYEYELLINKFKGNKEVRALSMTMSRTISGYINYRKFCETVLPKDLRVMDDLKYKMVPCPEISVVVSDLEQYVKSVKRKNAQMELLAKTAAIVGSGSGHDSNITFPFKSKNASIVNGLQDEPWITAEVKRIITKAEQEISGNKDAAPPAKGKAAPKVNVDMTKAHIIAIFKSINKLGKTPVVGLNAAVEELFRSNNIDIDSKISSSLLRDSMGCGNSKAPAYVIQWRGMSNEETNKLEKKVADDALNSLDELLRFGPKDDPKVVKNIFNKTMNTGTDLTRLIAGKPPKEKSYVRPAPAELISAAPTRADAVVIPNLYLDEVKSTNKASDFNASDWKSHFMTLGLGGDSLDAAITRKERSFLAEKNKMNTKTILLNTKSSIPTPLDTHEIKRNVIKAAGGIIIS